MNDVSYLPVSFCVVLEEGSWELGELLMTFFDSGVGS